MRALQARDALGRRVDSRFFELGHEDEAVWFNIRAGSPATGHEETL